MTKVESQPSRCTFCFEALEAFFQFIIFGCSNPCFFFFFKKNLFTKNLPVSQCRRHRFDPCPLEKEMAAHSGILAWRILWTEDPTGLQAMGYKRQT